MYVSTDVAARIKALAKQKKIPLKQLFAESGLTVNTLSNMRASMPKADNLAVIADALDCSVDYLLGRAATPERGGGGIPPALSWLVDAAADLTDEEVEKAVEYVDFLRASRK